MRLLLLLLAVLLLHSRRAAAPADTPTPSSSAPLVAGGFAVSAPPQCPSGAPAPAQFLWNIVYAQIPDLAGPGTGRAEGTDLRAVHGLSSQLGMVVYDGGGLGGGYSTPNFGLWPVCNAPPHCRNGWGPQNISLAAHVAALKNAVNQLIPNPGTCCVRSAAWRGGAAMLLWPRRRAI